MTDLPQLSIFTEAPWSDHDTSREAAKAIEPHIQRLEGLVLDHLLAWPPGYTSQELETLTGMDGNTIRPRLVALRARQLVAKTTEQRVTKSGRQAAVWKAR